MFDKPTDDAAPNVRECCPWRSLAIVSTLGVLSVMCAGLLSWIAG